MGHICLDKFTWADLTRRSRAELQSLLSASPEQNYPFQSSIHSQGRETQPMMTPQSDSSRKLTVQENLELPGGVRVVIYRELQGTADVRLKAIRKGFEDDKLKILLHLFWFGGHTWQYSRLTPGSRLRDHFWQDFRDHMRCWGWNTVWPLARQALSHYIITPALLLHF